MAKKDKEKKDKKNKKENKSKKNYWVLKVSIITFIVAILFSFASDLALDNSGIIIATVVLILLIIISVVFDGIGVAITACDLAPLTSMASRKIKGSKIAIKLKKNAEIVSNICADVIGDICGIVSGAAAIVIVSKIIAQFPGTKELIVTIILTSIVASLTVGGKAFMKKIAINKSKEFIMLVARIINIFIKEWYVDTWAS